MLPTLYYWHFFLKTASLIINWILWCHMSSYWKTTLTSWPNMKVRGQKFISSHLLKNPISLWIEIQMLNLWMSWENLCPNLTFFLENKMGNSHKRGWSHFKLNLNDWDNPFPKILRIYQWIEKNIFHWGKWNEHIKLIR